MNNQGLKYAALGALALAVVLGAVAYRMTLAVTEAAKEEAKAELAPQADQLEVATLAVVALKALPANRPIQADDIALKPISVVPERYFTRVDDVLGKTPLIDVDTGAPVTPRYFRDTNVLARLIPEGHQAMSVEISDVVAVGGFIRPGDEVDMLLYLRGSEASTQARILLEKVLVLAYEERIIERPEGLTEEEGRNARRSRVRTAVVAVAEADTTKLMLGTSVGEIRLALHRQSPEAAQPESGIPLAQASDDKTQKAKPDPKTITFAELARLQTKKAKAKQGKPKPPPYVIEVIKGNQAQKVRD